MASYDLNPRIKLDEGEVLSGYPALINKLRALVSASPDSRCVVVCEAYPGVYDDEVLDELGHLDADLYVDTRDVFPPSDELTALLSPYLTNDRVFGTMCYATLDAFFDQHAAEEARAAIEAATDLVVVYGFGASLLAKGDVTCYCDVTRWEIQLRYRSGMPNYHCDNVDEDPLRKIKRGYFVEWRLADKVKAKLLPTIDLYVDTTVESDPRIVSGETMRRALSAVVHRPFRTVPYFDPGVWGGQWMKTHFGLDARSSNYAWSFDGVPEENSIQFSTGATSFQMPAMNVVLYEPRALLGEGVYARFGAEFPIRFDLLDTMGGQNLSLQVHPTAEYIHRTFGMAYTQDESYYILDAADDACVYLGIKEGVDPDDMIDALRVANGSGPSFDAASYVNIFPARKHDHFLIPAGTVHCSGKNTMVLEISATPYMFTFKLWDWGRVGLDGRPRPVHIDHGSNVIRWDRTTKWVQDNLVNQIEPVEEESGCYVEKTGLHDLEFIETRRYSFDGMSFHDTHGTLNVLNVVEGDEAVVESPTGAFDPFRVHYAETFIIPASVGRYSMRAAGSSCVKVIKAQVRGTTAR